MHRPFGVIIVFREVNLRLPYESCQYERQLNVACMKTLQPLGLYLNSNHFFFMVAHPKNRLLNRDRHFLFCSMTIAHVFHFPIADHLNWTGLPPRPSNKRDLKQSELQR